MYIQRNAASTLQQLAKEYPVLAITGPRQSGKTTLARHEFPDKPYVTLEDPDQREYAIEDPRRFLSRFPEGAIIDEIQRCPDLISYLQGIVDERNQRGHFIITGSQQFGLLSEITQSLAGRVALLRLLPFTYTELKNANMQPQGVDNLLLYGLYPPIYDRQATPGIWYNNYVSTYLERDVRRLINVRDLNSFQRFVRMCAARTGQLLNLSALASDCGITHNTAKAWISVLEASYLIYLLQPHHRNYNKRLIKTPKLYFLDTGLAAWLMSINSESQLDTHAQRGALFETWVIGEMLKARFNQCLSSNIYFWRDRAGLEIDVVVESADNLQPVEIKSGSTLSSDYFSNIRKWLALSKQADKQSWLIYGGDDNQVRNSTHVYSWHDFPDQCVNLVTLANH